MNFSAWSIRNPVPAILLFVVLTFLGIRALGDLTKESFPDVDIPRITVSATLEGAAPDQLETEVARKIEDEIAAIGGVEHVRTTLTEGTANITVEFDIDVDSEEALSLVRNAVDSVRSDLPADIKPPIVSKITTAGRPVITYNVSAENMDEIALSWFVDNDITKVILAVPGVGKVGRIGGVDREIQVNLDPNRMAGLGVTAMDVSRQLKRVEQDASGGRGDIGSGIQSFRTLGALHSAEEIRKLDIPLPNGQHIKLDQVASVIDTIAQRSTYALENGKSVIQFEITRSRGASQVTIAEDVREVLAEFRKLHPQVTIEEAFNRSQKVIDNYEGSMHLLYEGALLAVIVVFWFLRDWRATFISAVALPLSIIPTFAVMMYLDFTLNTLSLLALALVVGILVDDAIVEVENIVRHLRMGKTPYQAAMEAADEIGFAVIATTFTLVAIFLPTGFMSGIIGRYFKQFGVTAAVAIMGSLVVARLLTPMMAAYLLKPHDKIVEKESSLMTFYLSTVKWCLNYRLLVVIGFVVFVAGSLMLAGQLKKGFVPSSDVSRTQVVIELQPGSTLEQTRDTVLKAEKLLAQNQDVKQMFSSIGVASSGGKGPGSSATTNDVRTATMNLILTDRSERSYSQKSIEKQLRLLLKALPGARVSVGSGETGERLLLTIASDDPIELDRATQNIALDLRTVKGLGNIVSSASLQRPEIQIKPKFERAAELGVTSEAIAQAVRVATVGDFSSAMPKLNLPQRQVPINVRLDDSVRHSVDAIRQLRIPSNAGTVSLSTVADISLKSGPQQIARLDRMRNVTFDIELGGRLIGDVIKEVNALPAIQNLPPSVHQIESGDAQRMSELFGSFGSAMAIGVLCIYVVLVLLFNDFLQPITILGALPLSFGGAFFALLVTGNNLSMPSVIGILMLMGVVTKNSILLVEYTIMSIKEFQMSRQDAIIDGCKKRVRPIVMTSIAMGAGMMPIALGLGADPSFRSPMAITVIGGLITSTILSIIVIPVFYTYVDDFLSVLQRTKRLIIAQH